MSMTGRYAGIVASLSVLAATAVYAAAFSSVAYDQKTDELIVTMSYQGSNPDHQFSVQWGDCQTARDGGNTHQIVGVVLDSQWNDDAVRAFTKTVRFSLAGVNCRPATLTLRSAPRFEYTLQIP
jgi:hypothetical protein